MIDLNDYYYFVKVVEYGGFSPAGRALGIPKSKLSRRIAGLEEQLGVKLIYRSTRQFNVTEIGLSFLTHCKAMLVEADAARAAVESIQTQPCGKIKITCPVALLNVHIGQVLADFMVEYPKVTIHLEATNRRIDLVAEGVDVAIRVRPAPIEDSEFVLKFLSERSQILIASPALVAKHGIVNSPSELASWPSLGLGAPQHHYHWDLFTQHGESANIVHHPRYVTSDMIALRKAAIAGVGVVQLPSLFVSEALAEGSLIHMLPDWQPKQDIIHLVYPSRRGLLPSVRALVDYIAAYYKSFDEP